MNFNNIKINYSIYKNSESFENYNDYFKSSFMSVEYSNIFIYFVISVLIAIILIGVSYSLAPQHPESEKLSPYECGFEPYEDTRSTFDLNFSLIAILFIIFDIEIIYLIPWCINTTHMDLLHYWSMVDFILELGVGYCYALNSKALDFE